MNKTLIGAATLALTASTAFAGGIERSTIDYGLMFQDGTQMSLGHALVTPNVSGEYTAATGGGDTGNMAKSYGTFSFGYKNDIGERLAFGLYHNQAYGAGAFYSQGFYTGLRADWQSQQTAAILKYSMTDRVSVFGGLRYVNSAADITIPDQMIRARVAAGAAEAQAAVTLLTGLGVPASDPRMIAATTQLATLTAIGATPAGALQYDATGDKRGDWGYVLGAAYEIPDIALRVGLTWESSVTHKFDTAESLPGFGIGAITKTEVEMPQSVTLDFQTGVAAGTLVFGGVKWTEWSKWEVRTPGYESVTGDAITGFDDDTVTWRLGMGKQFNERYSAFGQVTFEKSTGKTASRLSPTDGRLSVGLGAQFTEGAHKIRFGVEYINLGDATDASGVEFSGNSAIGVGLSYTTSF